MLQQERINKQLNDDYDTFLNAKYTGKIAPPDYIIDLFKKAILALPPYAHKINFRKIKVIAGMKVEELTNGLLQDVIKVVLNTSLDKLFIGNDFFNSVIDDYIEMEKFVLAYNNHMDGFKKNLEMKKKTLESLSGVRNNGMSVIPQA